MTITDREVDISTNEAQLSRRYVCLLAHLPAWFVSEDINFALQHCILGEPLRFGHTILYMLQVLLSAVYFSH